MYIDISSLSQGINKLELKGDAESLELSETGALLEAPVRVDLTLNVFEENIKIDGVVRTEVAEECSRCLQAFRRPVEAEIHLYATTRRPGRGAGDAEDEDEEDLGAGYLIHDGSQLDLRGEVRSAILLSAPVQPLCGSNCKGLCPGCGQNLNDGKCSCEDTRTDSRWKGLEKLQGDSD
jgi:uncharacterized protein